MSTLIWGGLTEEKARRVAAYMARKESTPSDVVLVGPAVDKEVEGWAFRTVVTLTLALPGASPTTATLNNFFIRVDEENTLRVIETGVPSWRAISDLELLADALHEPRVDRWDDAIARLRERLNGDTKKGLVKEWRLSVQHGILDELTAP